MATLALSTVGTLFGGPVGGAIGSLVGQSIDQQIFGSPRRGPRLGDLSVQTSSYGTQIPRIYGTMRVAGSIVWSTDLVQSGETSGAKGQPDTTFSYSVSFAVALASRPLVEVRRIWADGKLLRGAAGDFKVSTEFRFYDGRESQEIDPLIGSIEGPNNTPAYRGIALAVFENLELAEYGNRIPFLTFEVVADEAPPLLGAVLQDASAGLVDCDETTSIGGYAAMGPSISAAVEPIVETFGIDLREEGSILRSSSTTPAQTVIDDDLGCSADNGRVTRFERAQTRARSSPSSLSLSYYEAQRDYQLGLSHSDVIDQFGTEAKIELPGVLGASDARTLTEDMMARRWARRDKLVLRLPPRFITLGPGAQIELTNSPIRWQVHRSTVDGMVAVVELRPVWRTQAALAADPGRALATHDVVAGELSMALLELPDLRGEPASSPTLYLAASTPTAGWKPVPVEVSCGAFMASSRTAGRKAVMGHAATRLTGDSVAVQLIDVDQWLNSCDDHDLTGGANLALIGDELLQFAEVQPLGAGRFRLTRLRRGLAGTERALAGHAIGDLFLLINPRSMQPIALPDGARGSVVTVTRPTTGVRAATTLRSRQSRVREQAAAVAAAPGGTAIDTGVHEVIVQILGALRQRGLMDA
jgi:hypothetical protein